jgi:hypothetical protein
MNIQPIEYRNQRILTTAQLAEAYGTDEKRISENFNRNEDRYTYGKHYFYLEGEALRSFKETTPQIAEYLKYAPSAYLWTEKGTNSILTPGGQQETVSIVSARYDRTGHLLSRRITRQAPDDGRVERGIKLLFDLACKSLGRKKGAASNE